MAIYRKDFSYIPTIGKRPFMDLIIVLCYLLLVFTVAFHAKRKSTQENETDGLLGLAIKKAIERVIVKRHKNSTYLEDIKPSYSVKGKVVRYDIYIPN